MIKSFQTDGTTWWNRLPLGFLDTTAPPGYLADVPHPGHGSVRQRVSWAPRDRHDPGGTPPLAVRARSARRQPELAVASRRDERHEGVRPGGLERPTLNSANTRNIAGALLNDSDSATNFPGTTSTSVVQGVSPFWGSGPQTFSLETWLQTSTNNGGKIIGFGDSNTGRSSSNGNDRNLYMNNAGQIYFGVRPDMGTRITINSPASYRDNQWHHVVATLGSDGMKLYVDGNQVAANANVKKAQVYRGYWRIGGDQLSSWPSTHAREAITANLDEIAVYPYALSASRVSAHFAASGRGGNRSRTIRPTACRSRSRRHNHSVRRSMRALRATATGRSPRTTGRSVTARPAPA